LGNGQAHFLHSSRVAPDRWKKGQPPPVRQTGTRRTAAAAAAVRLQPAEKPARRRRSGATRHPAHTRAPPEALSLTQEQPKLGHHVLTKQLSESAH